MEATQVVREEYDKASGKFLELLRLLGKDGDPALEDRVTLFFRAMEGIDRHHDNLPSSIERQNFRNTLFASLRGEERELPLEIRGLAKELRESTEALGKTEELICYAEGIFSRGELLRETREVNTAIELTLEEGSLTAELLLLTLANEDPEFAAFIRELGAAGNLYDDLVDLKEDHLKGERNLAHPELFYFMGIPRVVSKMVQIVINYPQYSKPAFLLKCLKALARHLKRKCLAKLENDTRKESQLPPGSRQSRSRNEPPLVL